jgi:hypothetical protein|tara:strand:+ start:570 stop:719 length:150 start_codon:yes stop_codon:yes gene_type:complete
MMSHERSNKMADEADWKEGINAFRENTRRTIELLEQEISKIKQLIKEIP